jgi:hypothetical protein
MWLLVSCGRDGKRNSELQKPTWSADIAGIVYNNCTVCHRPGESGIFPLMSYNDAVKRAQLIRFVTRTKYMPPWPADPEYSHYSGERFLTTEQIRMITRWVDDGAPRGDSTLEPRAPVFTPGSFFRKPDLVVHSPRHVQIKGNGTDVFFVMKFPFAMSRDTLLDFAEFVPHQRKLIHHVNGHLVGYDSKRKFNYLDGESFHEVNEESVSTMYSRMDIPYTDGKSPEYPALAMNTVYYLPGYEPPHYPGGIGGWHMKKDGLFLLNNIHFGPSAESVTDSSHINVFFRRSPITRPVTETQLGTFGVSSIDPHFVIPANEVRTFHTQKTVAKTISILSVNPHMHLVGKTFLAFAVTANRDTIPFIRIKNWDFRWQYYYTFRKPLKIEAGSTIHAYGTYDNTEKNPNNPFHPPRVITEGNGIGSMKTTEEMFQFIFTYMLYKPGDENIDLDVQ